ncbi:hypothetical protein QQP08_021192 [Theobroma cacao]|nr:hypothetical protein QQP08_021192 [Theobroma cacao]
MDTPLGFIGLNNSFVTPFLRPLQWQLRNRKIVAHGHQHPVRILGLFTRMAKTMNPKPFAPLQTPTRVTSAESHGWKVKCFGLHVVAGVFFLTLVAAGFFLWNPTTLQKIRLPLLKFEGSIHHCTFSSSPSDPNCMILLSAKDVPLIIFLQLGDEQWTEINYEEEMEKCLKESRELVQQGDQT